MRVLVTGARDWPKKYASIVRVELTGMWVMARNAREPLTVVHGACPTGVDQVAEAWARARGIATEPHPADWERHGKAAGPIRNRQMVDAGADRCVAFLLPGSVGTLDCARKAEAAGIPTRRIRPDETGGAA